MNCGGEDGPAVLPPVGTAISRDVSVKVEMESSDWPLTDKLSPIWECINQMLQEPQICTECRETFQCKKSLERHRLIHTGEKPFTCNGGGERIAESKNLDDHVMNGVETESGLSSARKEDLERRLHIDDNDEYLSHNPFDKQLGESSSPNSNAKKSSQEKPYNCTICGKSFAQRGNLTQHQNVHSVDKPFSCSLCDKRFKKRGNLKTHMVTHSGEKPHCCKECGKSFALKADVKRHALIHSTYKQFSCRYCEKRFRDSGHLKRHMMIHSGEKPFSCVECGKSFIQKGHLTSHQHIHTGDRPFACSICEKRFRDRWCLSKHMISHSEEKLHSCVKCGKTFHRNSDLNRHLLTHTDIKPFPCSLCGKRFRERINLKHHMIVHSGEKPFSCNECGKSFTQNGGLKKHLRIHARGENQSRREGNSVSGHVKKENICTECGKTFSQKGSLNRHRRIHNVHSGTLAPSKDKAPPLATSDKKYWDSTDLTVHRRQVAINSKVKKNKHRKCATSSFPKTNPILHINSTLTVKKLI